MPIHRCGGHGVLLASPAEWDVDSAIPCRAVALAWANYLSSFVRIALWDDKPLSGPALLHLSQSLAVVSALRRGLAMGLARDQGNGL